jgi:cobalt/nickel transport system ATP-binding protein
LHEANLHAPHAVRLARKTGLDATARPVTEADLVELLTETGEDSELHPLSLDGGGHD